MNRRLTCAFVVRERGLEPLRPKTPGPKPDAAASYATPALAPGRRGLVYVRLRGCRAHAAGARRALSP
jgi:hypothetical protein